MQTVIFIFCYAKCHYAECRYAEGHSTAERAFLNLFSYQPSDTTSSTNKLQLTGRNLGRVFNSRSGYISAVCLFCYEAKQPNLKLNS
jgi:hypothetical protein